MKRIVIAVLAMSIAVAVWAENAVDPKALVGLWAARRDFGPHVRGVLLIEKEGAQWRAQIAGREAPVTIAQGTMSFALPTNEGRFRGSIAGHRLNGYWIQPFGVSTGFEISTPVTLAKQADGRWRGVVQPIDDHMTMFMPVSSRADGMLTAFLINPERNFGRFTDVRRIELDGTRVTLLGKDNKVVLEGRYDAETDSISVLSWRGGSYDLHRATAADEAAFYPRGKTPVPYVYRKPSERDDGWPIGSIGEAGIDGEALASFINDLTAMPIDSLQVVQIHAFLLARHGKLLVEEYFHGSSPDEPHDTRSAAKSLTAVLTGAAVLHGYPISPATHVYEAMYGKAEAEKVEPRKRGITMEQLLTMSSGLDCDDNDPKSPGQEDTMQEQTVQPDWYRFTLDLKMIREPGQKAVYCSCQPNLAGGVLARTTGKWLPDLFRELVAGPLQFRHWGMPMTPTGDAYMGGGVRLLPRDFMKIGQVMIDGGRWKGKQIISPDWVKRSSSVFYDLPPYHLQYGYLFWITDYPWKERKVRAFFASGNGGQVVMSIPELDLVIGFFGGNYSDSASSQSRRVYVPQYVLPAVK